MSGLRPIPWLAIHQWCEANGFYGENRDEIFHFVRAVDVAWLDYHDKKDKADIALKQAKSNNSKGVRRI